MKHFILAFVTACLVTTMSNPARAITFPDRPPMDDYSNQKVETYIVQTNEPAPSVIKQVKRDFPHMKIGTTYKHVFHGFAITGERHDIQKIKQLKNVVDVHRASTYKVTIDDSVPFIGVSNIGGIRDNNGNRLTGKGITVGVIDTGIDYTHPDLAKNYVGGFDIVDNDKDPMETIASKEGSTKHGTHVAGVIAANGKRKGVAPEAKIVAYRALGPGGVGTSEQVIAAIEKAIEDHVDIINLSLGNTVNGPDWPTSKALNRAVENGIIAITSSGNSGPAVWSVGSPGTADKAITVGASYPPMQMPYLQIPLTNKKLSFILMQGSLPWNLTHEEELAFGGIGKMEQLYDVKGKIALIKRGELPFTEKVRNAAQAGAIAVLIYNSSKGDFAGAIEEGITIPAASISQEDGEWLIAQIQKGRNKVSMKLKNGTDLIAPFSSRGPVTQMYSIKPDVIAPGVGIESTVPGGYQSMDGTSMAAPHVAGAVALIKQAHPNWTSEQIKAALMNTAVQLIDETSKIYPPYVQGAGRVKVDAAVHAKTLVYPSSITFGKLNRNSRRQQITRQLTIENVSNETQAYRFKMPEYQKGIQWKLPFSFTLQPSEKKSVNITMDIQPFKMKEGIHNGWFQIEGGDSLIKIPYLYVIEEPNYPRVMGFTFEKSETPDTYRYEVYLPGGAEEMGILLYDPDTLQFVRILDIQQRVPRGLYEVELSKEEVGEQGKYKAIVYAKKEGQEDFIESQVVIER